MKLVIRKKTSAEWLVLYTLVIPFFFSFFIDLLKLPSLIKYTADIAWICLLVLILVKRNLRLDGYVRHLLYVVGLFFLTTIVGLVMNYQSILYYLWGLRNNLRFFVFFFACIVFMQGKTAKSMLKFLTFCYGSTCQLFCINIYLWERNRIIWAAFSVWKQDAMPI